MVCLAMIALFALTFLFPEHTWAFHHIDFLPKTVAIGLLLLAVIQMIVPFRFGAKQLKVAFVFGRCPVESLFLELSLAV